MFNEAMAALRVEFSALSTASAATAGRLWRDYRARHARTRERVVPDFLIGAHALLQADALLTRDHGFYRTFFKGLRVIDPTRRSGT